MTLESDTLLYHVSRKKTISIKLTDIESVKTNKERKNGIYNHGTLSILTKNQTYHIKYIEQIKEVETHLKKLTKIN